MDVPIKLKHIFAEIIKRDDDQKTVTGYASTEALDSQGEIVEKEAVGDALSDYLGAWDKVNQRWVYGGIREMHQLSAVGKTIKAKIDNKGLYIVGKVVDDNAWKKVKEGVYNGFSIGGEIVKQVKNRIKALKLKEISLVDRPANPEAVFAMVKVDAMGKTYDTQSQAEPTEVSAMPEMPFSEITDAAKILELAKELRDLYSRYEREKRPTTELRSALRVLRELATKILTGDNRQQFNKIFDAPEFMKNEIQLPTIPHEEVLAAAHILDLARDVRMLLNIFEEDGRPTVELQRALTALKTLATKVLSENDRKKFDTVLYNIDFQELEKAKLPFKNRKDMPAGDFAYIDSKGGKHLPIHDKAHIQNAMARFNQTQFESPEKKKSAARKILAAARRAGIEIDPSSSIAQTAKKTIIPNYINLTWAPGYFEQMRKVMG